MKQLLIFSTLFVYFISFSQVAIGEIDPDPHAQLDVSATQKGVLIPRITLRDVTLAHPFDETKDLIPESLLIYNEGLDVAAGYYYWYKNRWNKIVIQSDPDNVATNSWFVQNTSIPATENTQNIYQMGTVSVGKNQAIPGVALDVDGAFRAGKPDSSLPTPPIGSNSIAVGWGAVAGGANSGAWGMNTRALGNASLAWGHTTKATGSLSTAWGFSTSALSYGETVFGQYNAIQPEEIPNPDLWMGSHPLLQVGNGNFAVNNNALTILKNGDTGIGIMGVDEDAKPTARLDIGSGTVRIREINNGTGVVTDKIVVADADGVLKTIAPTGSSATTNKLESFENTMTSTVNDVEDTASIINTVSNTLGVATAAGYPLTTTVNGMATTTVNIPEPWNVAGGSIKASSNTQAIYMNGKVGIGNFSDNNPSAWLDVKGDALINGVTVGKGGGNVETNTATGHLALISNDKGGIENTATGYLALFNNKTGKFNTANGSQALYNNTSGSNNIATGSQALYTNTTGSYNTANGYQALFNNDHITGIGNDFTGSYNTATGYQALYKNTTGYNNTATGYQALENNTTGYYNTANGYGALYNNTIGNANTAIGHMAGPGASSFNLSNTIAIGYDAKVNASNTIRLGNDDIKFIYAAASITSSSDRRWKDNIKTIPLGLDFINKVRPVEYIRKNNDDKTKEWGVIAQELQQSIKNAGYEDAGVVQGDHTPDNYLSVRYTDLIAPLIKAVQELSLQNEDLKKKEGQMERELVKVSQLENQINEMKKIMQQLMAK